MNEMPRWMLGLEEEDLNFIKKFMVSSGSLKEMARLYDVTYPTVRNRLDRVIEKIKLAEEAGEDPYISLIKRMVIEEKIDFDAAAILMREYRRKEQL